LIKSKDIILANRYKGVNVKPLSRTRVAARNKILSMTLLLPRHHKMLVVVVVVVVVIVIVIGFFKRLY